LALAAVEPIIAGEEELLLLRFKIEGRKTSVALRRAGRTVIARQHLD